MPEVVVRKRLSKRSGDWKYRSKRWFYRNRPLVAVAAAFGLAILLALLVLPAALKSLSVEPAEPAVTSP